MFSDGISPGSVADRWRLRGLSARSGQCARGAPSSLGLKTARIRAELPMTARELSGIETAAIRGVMTAAIASGTMMRL